VDRGGRERQWLLAEAVRKKGMTDFILDAIDVLRDQACSGIAVVVVMILVLTPVFVAKVIYVNLTSDLTLDGPGSSRRSMSI